MPLSPEDMRDIARRERFASGWAPLGVAPLGLVLAFGDRLDRGLAGAAVTARRLGAVAALATLDQKGLTGRRHSDSRRAPAAGGQGAVHGGRVQIEPARELLDDVGAGHPGPADLDLFGEAPQLAQDPGVLAAVLGEGREAALHHEPVLGGEVLAGMLDQLGEASGEAILVVHRQAVDQGRELALGPVHGVHAEEVTGVEVGDRGHGSTRSRTNACATFFTMRRPT